MSGKRGTGSSSKQRFANTSLKDALGKLREEQRASAEARQRAASLERDRQRAQAKARKRARVTTGAAGTQPYVPQSTSGTVREQRAYGSELDMTTAGPDDEHLFRIAMGDVEPIRSKRPSKVTPSRTTPVPDVVSEDAEVLAQLAELVATGEGLDLADTDEYMEGISHGVDRSLLVALRRGDFSVQGHVDLHGLGVEAAKEELERFLFESRRKGARCVLVVHGRGLHSKDREPVLKERVGVWLSKGRLSRLVLAFATARPVDGGAGALYVLLRR